MRLVDEIVSNSSYLDYGGQSPIEFVALSYESLNIIKTEVIEEYNLSAITSEDIDKALAMKHLIMPSMSGIDYRFLKEIVFT